jgi:phosphopantetheinyl transferase (holo-ACP synthase)
MKRLALLLPLLAALTACEQLGIEDPAKVAAAKEAEGKAIGSACRHAMRAIEDCYVLNPKAQKEHVSGQKFLGKFGEFFPVEFFNGFEKSQVSFLDKIEKCQI